MDLERHKGLNSNRGNIFRYLNKCDLALDISFFFLFFHQLVILFSEVGAVKLVRLTVERT